jgi:hypothetical protein
MNLTELPGAELILPQLKDLQNGKTDTVGVSSFGLPLIATAPCPFWHSVE